MPTKERLDEFVSAVVRKNHAETIELFYHEEASIQENLDEPRRGRDVLVAHESAATAQLKSMHSFPPLLVVAKGDHVAIHWRFEMVDPSGQRRRLQEVAIQRWRGDRIAAEQFFYDSATAWQAVD